MSSPSARAGSLSPILFGLLLLGSACGDGSATSTVGGRLWVDELPSSPRADFHALILLETPKGSLGSFTAGSVYRSHYDAIRWRQDGERRGEIERLQDRSRHPIKLRPCEPKRGFDRCIELHGDPTGVVRYQSKRSWAIPRRDRKSALEPVTILSELAENDDELKTLLSETER